MKQSFNRNVVVALLALTLLVGSVSIVNWPKISPYVTNLLAKQTPPPSPLSVINPPLRPVEYIQYCIDGPPFFPLGIATQANNAVATAVDGLVVPNQRGAHVFVSYIDSSSFEHNALIINVAAVGKAPEPPPYPNFIDPYQKAKAMSEYKQKFPRWQAAYAAFQRSLDAVKAHVHQETLDLRSLIARSDSTGSSIWGCLNTAWLNFQGVQGKKAIILASTMIQNVNDPIPTGFTLAGVEIKLIYHNCIFSAAWCARNDANWKRMFTRYGSGPVSFSTVQQSEATPLSI